MGVPWGILGIFRVIATPLAHHMDTSFFLKVTSIYQLCHSIYRHTPPLFAGETPLEDLDYVNATPTTHHIAKANKTCTISHSNKRIPMLF